MKKFLVLLVSVVLLAGLLISCNPNANADKRAIVKLNVLEESSKSLSSSIDYADKDTLTWYYKATTSSSVFNYGARSEWEELGALGSSKELSLGIWNFELKAVKSGADADANAIYSGSLNGMAIIATGAPIEVKIPVSVNMIGDGYLVLDDIAIILRDGNEATVDANMAKVDGEEIALTGPVTRTLEAGTYDVDVWFVDTDGVIKAEESITVTIYGGATTKISGNLSEITQDAIIGGEITGSYSDVAPSVSNPVIKTEVIAGVSNAVKATEAASVSNGALTVTVPAETVLLLEDGVSAGALKSGFEAVEDANIEIASVEDAKTFELTLNVSQDNETLVEVSYNIGAGLDISKVFHNDVELPNVAPAEGEYYNYDNITGILTLYIYHASYITIIEGDGYVSCYEDLVDALAKNLEEVVLIKDVKFADDATFTIPTGKKLTVDLNGYTILGESVKTGSNANLIDVRGVLTLNNGAVTYKHKGENMGWGNSTNIFNVTAGGELNLNNIKAENLGGSDMSFVAHLNNWGEVTLNADGCELVSPYVAVRVFNSGYDMNNVSIKNSTLKGNSNCFWVHNYTAADFGSEAKADAQKALLNIDILNGTNEFVYTKAPVRYGFTNSIYVAEAKTEAEISAALEASFAVGIADDIELENPIKITADMDSIIYLNGNTLSIVDTTSNNFELINNAGNLIVEGPGKLTVESTINSGWSRYSAVIANTVGGDLTVGGDVVIEHLGGTDMSYGIDNLTNGKGTSAVVTIKNATVKSPYRAVRQFLNGTEATNELYVKSGAQIIGTNKSIWMQDPNMSANTGKLVVEEGAELYGDVYLFVTAGSTSYPVEVSIAEEALADESKVVSGNVPASYCVVNKNGSWTVCRVANIGDTAYATLEEAVAAAGAGETVEFNCDVTINANNSNGYGATGVRVTDGMILAGNGNTLTVKGANTTWDSAINPTNGTIKDLTVAGAFRGIFMGGATGDVYIDNVTFQDVVYTFNSDGGNENYGVYISNSTLNGWTSFSKVHKEVVFTDCEFGMGSGYAFCRPYNACVFEDCEFSTDMKFDTTQATEIVFKNCTYGGVKITAENAASLQTDDVVFFYNGVGNASFQ